MLESLAETFSCPQCGKEMEEFSSQNQFEYFLEGDLVCKACNIRVSIAKLDGEDLPLDEDEEIVE